MTILDTYNRLCATWSDIYEHLPTLKLLSTHCSTIVECGVREVISSYAFASGLPADGKLVMVDPYRSKNVDDFLKKEPRASFLHASDLDCPLVETDMLFIDTWHIYGQLKRELAYWHGHVRKYIVMHDTTVDAITGETIRNGWDAVKQSAESGIPVDEIKKGLWPAIEEFLEAHPEWTLAARYHNNHGLTVLMRIGNTEPSSF